MHPMETGFRQALSSPLPTTPVRQADTSQSNPSADTSATPEKTIAAQDEASLRREEQRLVQALAARDREVHAHESAHVAVGRQYVVSGPSYTYQQGPNGRQYAIGGEVQLDVSAEAEANATLNKAEIVRRAALAPVEPSAQDRLVAARATQLAAQARLAIAVEQRELRQAHQPPSASSSAVQEFKAGDQEDISPRVSEFA